MKKIGQSIYDTLISIMPGLKDRLQSHGDYIDPVAANSLFSLWRTGEQKVEDRVFKKPSTIGHEEVRRMKDAGLVQQIGDKIEITDKGAKVIKIMVLGDNRSIFEDNDLVIDYNKALTNTKGIKTAKNIKAAQGWWDRFTK
jgi:hypothetical protein